MAAYKDAKSEAASPKPNATPSQVKPPVLPLDDKGRPYHTQATADQDARYTASRTDLGKRKIW